MKNLCVFFLLLSSVAFAQRCDSISASFNGEWKPISTAPKDGTRIEFLETFGVAPWYGQYRWMKKGEKYKAEVWTTDRQGHSTRTERELTESSGRWVNVEDTAMGINEDSCGFWRATSQSEKYVDPTGGKQKSVAYWCAAMHLSYNKKKDACE